MLCFSYESSKHTCIAPTTDTFWNKQFASFTKSIDTAVTHEETNTGSRTKENSTFSFRWASEFPFRAWASHARLLLILFFSKFKSRFGSHLVFAKIKFNKFFFSLLFHTSPRWQRLCLGEATLLFSNFSSLIWPRVCRDAKPNDVSSTTVFPFSAMTTTYSLVFQFGISLFLFRLIV